jgi:hypothetical protein
MERPYTHWHWAFSEREIDILVEQIKNHNQGFSNPIDRRRVPQVVQDYGKERGLFAIGEDNRWYYAGGWMRGGANALAMSPFDTVRDAPIEALWRLIEPLIGPSGSIGHSINRDRRWRELNVYELDDSRDDHYHRQKQQRAEKERFEALHRMAQYNYISFQAAGTVWDIRTRPVADRLQSGW